MKRVLRVGSRESALALVQTQYVCNEIIKKHPDMHLEIVKIKTEGDRMLNKRLDKIGGKGLFIKELENALIDKTIDFAVHSLKDMPSKLPEGVEIAAVSKREDPRDVIVTKNGAAIPDIPKGAVIGTGSVRRQVQLKVVRPDLRFKLLRGNVVTRLEKLANDEYDALVLASAGLKRLNMLDEKVCLLDTDMVIPAAGQGILAVEARIEDNTGYLRDSIHCVESELASRAERAFMIKLDGGCSAPMGAFCIVKKHRLILSAMLADEGREVVVRQTTEGDIENPELLGIKTAEIITEKLAEKLGRS